MAQHGLTASRGGFPGKGDVGTVPVGRRSVLRLTAALVPAGSLQAAAAPATPKVTNAASTTRILLPVTPGAAWRVMAAADPPRLLVDLPGATWSGPARLPGSGLVAAIERQGQGTTLRAVIALAEPIAAPLVVARAGRLRLDLLPGTAAGFARLVDGRVLAAAPSRGGMLPLVVIDAGHGGRDPGAVGAQGTLEKRITLAAALELRRQLEAAGRCRVGLTRTRDVFVPLGDRIELARRREAALFLSLHADSAPGARGASVYTLAETASDPLAAALARRENEADRQGGLLLPSVSPEVQRILLSLMRQETRTGSERLARLAVAALEGEVPLLPNCHRRAAFVVLKAPDVPAALVEMGFLSHPQDEAALNKPAYRARVAGALTEAVHRLLGSLATPRAPAIAAAGQG